MSFNLGSFRFDTPVVLAPMAGVTDLPFRRMVGRFGVDLTFSEMIASRAMIEARDKTMRMAAASDGGDAPISVQIVGGEPEAMAEAARINRDQGAALIDINMGCPVKKIVKGEAGAALMRDEILAGRIMEAVVKAVDVPVTVKMRAGWDEHNRNAPRLARIARESGIAAVTVHGRTRAQFYGGRADWDFIAEVKGAAGIPIIANGDVETPEDARRLLDRSGADGVMIGRATYGRPWLPGKVRRFLKGEEAVSDPSIEDQLSIILDHYEEMLIHYGSYGGLRIARKHLSWYSKGLPGSAEFRSRLMRLTDPEAVRGHLMDFYRPLLQLEAA